MRLLNVHSLTFYDYHFEPDQIPKYAIASHRWGRGAETSLEEVQEHRNIDKTGYKKVLEFADHVKSHIPDVDWLWIDTPCLDGTPERKCALHILQMSP